ncbi:MAG: ABC transporter substrate-binding protein [Anaerolineae bacterium]|nr:ABC transporter substrate-binding protein [Anaerolineae bacterium]
MKFPARIILLAISILGIGITSGCRQQQPIRIGAALELSGKEGDLGVQIRNGAKLALDAANRSGGINRQLIEMIVKDDQGIPEVAQQVDRELIEAGVIAIIGHVTSQQSLAGLSVTQPAGVVLLSATSTSVELTGKDDLFFRIVGDNERDTRALAKHIQEQGIHNMAVIYDEDNASYSRTYVETFASSFAELGGNITTILDFSSASQPDFNPILEQARASEPEGLLLVASAVNTAFLAQKARLMEWGVQIFSSDWAYSEAFLQNGGHAIEGVQMISSFDINNPAPTMEQFRQEYKATFGTEPNFGAAQGYEAAAILIEALRRCNGDFQGLPDALRSIQNFEGLAGSISINPYGDVTRPLYLMQVKDGKWTTVRKLTES